MSQGEGSTWPSEGKPVAAELSERIRSMLADAEGAAAALRHQAEQEAQARRRAAETEALKIVEDARRESERFLTERISQISDLSDEILERGQSVVERLDAAEQVRAELAGLVTALGQTAARLANEVRSMPGPRTPDIAPGTHESRRRRPSRRPSSPSRSSTEPSSRRPSSRSSSLPRRSRSPSPSPSPPLPRRRSSRSRSPCAEPEPPRGPRLRGAEPDRAAARAGRGRRGGGRAGGVGVGAGSGRGRRGRPHRGADARGTCAHRAGALRRARADRRGGRRGEEDEREADERPGKAARAANSGGNGSERAGLIEVESPAPAAEAGQADPDQALGARLVALQMAVAGGNRGEVETHLRRAFDLSDPEPILDDIFGTGTDSERRVVWPEAG